MHDHDEEFLEDYYINEIPGFDKFPLHLILSRNLSNIWRYAAISKYDDYFMKGAQKPRSPYSKPACLSISNNIIR